MNDSFSLQQLMQLRRRKVEAWGQGTAPSQDEIRDVAFLQLAIMAIQDVLDENEALGGRQNPYLKGR